MKSFPTCLRHAPTDHEWPSKPLIFLAYSLGSLVLKEATVQMADCDKFGARYLDVAPYDPPPPIM